MGFTMEILIDGLIGLAYSFFHTLVDWTKYIFPSFFSKSIDGDIVLITGGGSGIGRLMSLKLAKLGATIVTVDVNQKGNDETVKMVKSQGGTAFGYVCNLADREQVYLMAEKVKREHGVVSMLINNAGIVIGKSLLEIPDDKIELTFKVNIMAHFWTTKAFMPDMIAQKKGHIVTVASLAGHNGVTKLVDYCSSKFAAVGFDESLREELYALGLSDSIKTTVICPYYINTGMFDGVTCKLVDIQEPEYVVDRAVEGILTNTEIVVVPRWVNMLMMVKYMVPAKGYHVLGAATGINTSMDHFTGRKAENASKKTR